MTSIILLFAVLLDWRFGEVKSHHPLVYFGQLANLVERQLNRYESQTVFSLRVLGTLAVALLVILPSWILHGLLIEASHTAGWIVAIIEAIGLYFCLGRQSLIEHALAIYQPLKKGDLEAARIQVGRIVSRQTETMDAETVTKATVESVLENSNDACFATLFWFFIGGLPLAVLHRFSNTLDAMWGYKTERFFAFGWAAAKLDDLLNWIPARLGALSLAVLGHRKDALACWKSQAAQYDSPNGGVIMATGAGALNIKLGGNAIYNGQIKQRPVLGCGRDVITADIPRSTALVNQAVILWVIVLGLLGWIF